MRQPWRATAALPLGILVAVALSTVLRGQTTGAGRSGITPPRPISQAPPSYTAAAMRARIEGSALVVCIVEPDGTVGPARIARSLDSQLGLDDEAVKSVKKWKFIPGMKDGIAVPVEVSIDVRFSLRGDLPPGSAQPLSDPASLLTLPQPFVAAAQKTGPALPDAGQWTEVVKDLSDLRIRVAYPKTWMARDAGPETSLLRLQRDGGQGAFLVTVNADRSATAGQPDQTAGQPDQTAGQPDQLLPPSTLLQTEQRLRLSVGSASEVISVGQARVSDRLWVWSDVRLSSAQMASVVPPALLSVFQSVVDGARYWTFGSAAGSQHVEINCLFAYLSTDPSGPENVEQAAAECGEILKRVSIEPF
jgi:TonB family protein